MLVNQNIINSLIKDAGATRYEKAKKYEEQGKVELTNIEYDNPNNFEISAIVIGTEKYKTYIEIKNAEIENEK